MAKQKTKKVPKTQQTGDSAGKHRFFRYCLRFLFLGVVVLAWMSYTSFSAADWPSGQSCCPGQKEVANRAGLVGAYLAWVFRYWVGSGTCIALVVLSAGSILMMCGKRLGDLPWRFAGLVLMTCSFSAAAYLMDPAIYRPVIAGHAGILGHFTGDFLLRSFGRQGGWLVIVLAGFVGLVLTADTFLMFLVGKIREKQYLRVAADRMARWRSRAKPQPATAVVSSSGSIAKPQPRAVPPGLEDMYRPTVVEAPPQSRGKSASSLSADDDERGGRSPEEVKTRIIEALTGGRKSEKNGSAAGKSAGTGKRSAAAAAAGGSGEKKSAAGKAVIPSSSLLSEPQRGYGEIAEAQAMQRKVVLQQTFDDFNVKAVVDGYMTGPVITLFEVSLEPGVKVAAITNLATDIARALAVPAVRVVPPRFGKHTVGIEVPNLEKEIVRIKELMNMRSQADRNMSLPLYLGKDAGGDAIVLDLAKCPHMLIAGTTGSGKSVCINTIIMSMLLTRSIEDVRFILVDPKMVELAAFEKLPQLLCPTISDMNKAESILEWATEKMEERYELLREAGVKNIDQYNQLGKEELCKRVGALDTEEKAKVPAKIPRYVIIIDELADMMMTSSKEVEEYIIRIAQKARAVGIHLVLSTQRPSANVVTGLIKSNMPCRISFRVASGQESRIVLDHKGAEVLLGEGDMLVLKPGTSMLVRAQGTFVDDSEIKAIVDELSSSCEQHFDEELMNIRNSAAGSGPGGGERDELFDDAVEVVLQSDRGSVSLLQRRMQVGYGRASRIIDQMEDAGILGAHKGSVARECLITLDEWEAMKASIAADQSGENSLNGEPTSV